MTAYALYSIGPTGTGEAKMPFLENRSKKVWK